MLRNVGAYMRNRKKWLQRLLWSYLLIFFTISFLLVFIFFVVISQLVKEETGKSNQLYMQHIKSAIDYSLGVIDERVTQEIFSPELEQYMKESPADNPYLLAKGVSDRLRNVAQSHAMVSAVYLFRSRDRMVITNSAKMPLAQFGDREFVESLGEQDRFQWTGLGEYREWDGAAGAVKVVSLVRKMRDYSGGYGYLVVHVRVEALKKMIENASGNHINFIRVLDRDGNVLISNPGQAEQWGILSVVQSDYTQWRLESGIVHGNRYELVNILSFIWIGAALFVIVSGVVWLVLTVRHNYRPLESIAAKIQQYYWHKNNPEAAAGQGNYLHVIQDALDKLIEQATTYRKRSEEDLMYRKKHFFHELMEGNRVISEQMWHDEMERLELPVDRYDHMVAVVIEIDRYQQFCERYNYRDQNLLKFVISSAIQETMEDRRISLWSEWVKGHQLGMIVKLLREDATDRPAPLADFLQAVHQWLNKHLDFTVTIGVGTTVDGPGECPQSFEDAFAALHRKMLLGDNRIIWYAEERKELPAQPYKPIDTVRRLVQSFRLGDGQWTALFRSLIAELRASAFVHEDVHSVMNFLIYQLHREMLNMADEYRQVCTEELMPDLQRILERYETLDEWDAQLYRALEQAYGKMVDMRADSRKYQTLQEVREFIQHHYDDPDLSLALLSDRFDVKPANLSRYFKEEFGEKFVDYVVKVRIRQAQELLLAEPGKPVQDIGRQVGYLHAKTFIRIFKKEIGVTPGEYKRMHGKEIGVLPE